ncbi:MAG TPA: cupredoxin domain-containing protein [Actinomycetota bacterium]|nr:cupredoxin domain-containing protein [Actinomycetota bacterium]
MRRAMIFVAAMFLLGACTSGTADDATKKGDNDIKTKAVECDPSDSPLTLEAADLKFDSSCLASEADEEFMVTLANKDVAPHNISIYDKGGKQLFRGEPMVDPGVTHTYTVSSIPAGTHTFKCDIHPEMNGNFIAAG